MRILKFVISLLITIGLVYLLHHRWVVGGNPIPPLGKFLDPFQGFWHNIELRESGEPEKLQIAGLKGEVTIVFDSLMIPHIFAQNDEDLYLAQGYVTAKHRLWQMEFQTHAAAGRISEIIGKSDPVLNYDRGQRRLGMVFGAQHALEGMQSDPLSKMMIEKYSEGINQYIASLSYEDLPFEYKLLSYEPEAWTPLKCALLLKNMAQTLNIGDKDIEMSNALKLFGKDMIDVLYPDREPLTDPIVDLPGGWKFNPIKLDTVPLAVPEELISVKKLPPADPTTGSNNWAVSGRKTATGSPMLCGDPHLNLSLPSIWYAIQLHSPSVNVMGVSIPGSPAVIIGFNDSIAWSVTNAQRDLVDWFKISFENNSHEKYLLDGQWVKAEKVVEEFKIRDQPSFYDTVVYTHWGPITYDERYHAEDNLKHYAFRWIAHDPSNEILTFYQLNRARNHAEYMAALDHYSSPAQNFVFASVSGDIAMRIQGKYPVRRLNEGRFVLDGSHSSQGWQAFIPNDQNVMYKNPERGFVSSANQYPVDGTYPYYVTARNWEAYRNRRINQVLGSLSGIQPQDLMHLQNDNYNLKAAESLPLFFSLLDSTHLTTEEREAWNVLKRWDFFNNKDAEGASYYEAWWDNIMPLTWDEMDNKDIALAPPTTYNTIRLIREKPDLSFFDVKSTSEKETAKDVVRKAFALGVQDIATWKKDHQRSDVPWGAYKGSYIGHIIPSMKALSIPVYAGGNHDIVNAHSKTHGPSWRMVVSLEKAGVKAWAAYPGGQSGNPGSVHYSDMVDHWVNGKYFSLWFMHDAANRNKAVQTLTLEPSSKKE
jgi:penicillin amidase